MGGGGPPPVPALTVGGAGCVVVVVAVAGRHRQAVLPVGPGGADPGRGLGGRGRRLAEGRVLVSAELRLVVHVGVVDQRDVVDEVVDEELGVGHEVVDGVAGLGFLSALVERTTEGLHHPHLQMASERKQRGGSEEKGEETETQRPQGQVDTGRLAASQIFYPSLVHFKVQLNKCSKKTTFKTLSFNL